MDREKPDVSFTLLCCIIECDSQPDVPPFGFSDTLQNKGLMSGFYLQHLPAAARQHNTNMASSEQGTPSGSKCVCQPVCV